MAKVLIVDDEEPVLELMTAFLEYDNHVVASAGTVAQAQAEYQRFDPDLVVTDVNMPDGTGPDLLTWLWTRNSKAKVVLMSGSYGPEIDALAREVGAAAGLAKPFLSSGLIELTDRLMGRPCIS